uniref:Peptidase metallopeptidase domain-containing protein n=2 Tax=Arion vulgaris TaxID=1028688 RepID=A0A0B7AQA0_9EUPU
MGIETFQQIQPSDCCRNMEEKMQFVDSCSRAGITKRTVCRLVVPRHVIHMSGSMSSISNLSKLSASSSLLSSSSLNRRRSSLKLWWLLHLVLLFAVVCKSEADDGMLQTNLETELADKYLSSFGYYPHQVPASNDLPLDDASIVSTETPVAISGHTDDQRHRAIERLQRFFHLSVSGQLDDSTKQFMKVSRCGQQDMDVDNNEDENSNSEGHPAGNRRKKRYSINKYGDGTYAPWTVPQLSWKIMQPSRQISESQQRNIMQKSLAMWAKHVPVKFVEDGSGTPDISIRFVRGRHGPEQDPIFDGSPDRTVNVLAHAWGPGYTAKGLAGDVHFDDDDNWKNYTTLLGVAVHELGHSMGLGHSDDPNAIMFPVYREVAELGQDDINGIEELYGPNRGVRPVSPDGSRPRTPAPPVFPRTPDTRYPTARPVPRYRTERPDPRYITIRPDSRYRTDRQYPHYRTQRPDVTQDRRYRPVRPDIRYWTTERDPRIVPLNPRAPPYQTVRPGLTTQMPVDLCRTINVDAVFEEPTSTWIGRIYVAVSDENVHTITQHGDLIKSRLLKDVYPEVPVNPDVAFSISKKKTVYFIKDNTMWAYKEGLLEAGYPRSLRSLQFPERPKFSVTINHRDGTSRLLLFGARFWWTFDVDRLNTIVYQPISAFSGEMPSGVRFATQWTDNNLYAVTQDSYVIMDLDRRRITHEKPIAGMPKWLQGLCVDANSASRSVTSLSTLLIIASILKTVFL